jgi:hypothetical protein
MNRKELNTHIWLQHFQERVDLCYKDKSKVIVPKNVKSNCLELFLKRQILITQGIDQGTLKPEICAHEKDIEWILSSDPENNFKEIKGIFS